MSLPQVKAVSVSNSIPLYDAAPTRVCYYSINTLQLEGPENVPVAAISTSTPALIVDLSAPVKKTWVVKATMIGQDSITVGECEIEVGKSTFTAPIRAAYGNEAGKKIRPFPWVLDGKLRWWIREKSASTWGEWRFTILNLYVLAPNLPTYITNAGISIDLLKQKQLFKDWMVHPLENQSFAEFVTWVLFTQYPIRYEITSGAPKYSICYDKDGKIILQTWIDLWVSDMNRIRDNQQKLTTQPVNCYDLAAISHAIISLGLPDGQKLDIQFLKPFGYINTVLIGQGFCNNAQFREDKLRVCKDPLDTSRQPFENHCFLTKRAHIADENPLVYDACCGPTYEKTTDKYLEETIDAIKGLYQPQRPMGTKNDIKLVTIDRLVRTLSFEQYAVQTQPSGGKPVNTVFELVEACFNTDKYTVEPAFITTPTGWNYVCATWKATSKDGQHQLVINIQHFFDDITGAKMEYQRRKALFPQNLQKGIGVNDLVCMLNNSGVSMFHAAKFATKSSYLFTVEIDKENPEALKAAATALENSVLPNLQKADDNEIDAIKGADSSVGAKDGKMHVKVGETFQIKVVPKPITSTGYKVRWHGFDVFPQFGHVLRTKSELQNEGSVLFTFLARSPTIDRSEIVKISLYGPQLSASSREFEIVISEN